MVTYLLLTHYFYLEIRRINRVSKTAYECSYVLLNTMALDMTSSVLGSQKLIIKAMVKVVMIMLSRNVKMIH